MELFNYIWADPGLRVYYICVLLTVVPITRIFMRAGFKPFWSVLLLAPQVGLILCAAFLALRKWPAHKGA